MTERRTLNRTYFCRGSSANLPRLHTCENKVPFWDYRQFAVTLISDQVRCVLVPMVVGQGRLTWILGSWHLCHTRWDWHSLSLRRPSSQALTPSGGASFITWVLLFWGSTGWAEDIFGAARHVWARVLHLVPTKIRTCAIFTCAWGTWQKPGTVLGYNLFYFCLPTGC